MLWSGVVVAVLAAAAGYEGANWVRRRAKRAGLVQAPTHRSSHSTPTATGGGLGIVLGGTIACLFLAAYAIWPAILVLAASLAMAAIGLRDDMRPVAWIWRLAVQVLVIIVLVVGGIPLPDLQAAIGFPFGVPVLAILVLIGGIVWVNFFNFMDGIDGIAASEALFLFVSVIGLTLASVVDVVDLPLFWWIVALAAATLGFLAVNWPPAKIFMGDIGSTYLGLMTGFLALVTLTLGWMSLPQWLILVAVFVTDATVTLLRRLMRGENIAQAHRRHGYQHLSRRWNSHLKVTLGVIAIDVLFLLPLAVAAGIWQANGWLLALAAYAVTLGIAVYARSGAPEAVPR